ncbi:hypothetical protein BLOT_001377 [Blomia tropicalis]|nr:hypothetical protein BLOT_001377 [Blomia tropicalis]
MATNSKSSIQSNQKIRNIFAWNKQQWIIIIVTSLILLIWYYSSGTDNSTPWLTNVLLFYDT